MSLFLATPTLQLGIIVYAKPADNSYLIQPLDSQDSREAQIPAVPAGTSLKANSVVNTPLYEVGDYVLYVATDTGFWQYSHLRTALILCRVPREPSMGWKEPDNGSAIPKDGADTYYEDTNKLLEQPKDKVPEFADAYQSDVRIAGDYIASGDNSILRVSNDLIEEHAGDCHVILNGVDGRITEASVLKNKATLAHVIEEKLVNDSTLSITKEQLSTHRGFTDSREARNPDRIAIKGDLLYGESEALLNIDREPIAVTERTSDGEEIHRAIKGVLFEQTTDMTIQLPKYKHSINYDKNVADAPKEGVRVIYDRLKEAGWEKLGSENKNKTLRKPGDITDKPKDKIKDIEGNKWIETHTGKASFGFLPEGGFVIRDAWGSEIRMEDGDIQLSAARNFKLVGGNDGLVILGGVLSTTAASIQGCATIQNIDLQAKEDINTYADKNINLVGKESTKVASEKLIDISSGEGTIQYKANNIVVDCTKELYTTASKVYIEANAEAFLGTPQAMLHLSNNEAHIGGSSVWVNGDCNIVKSIYKVSNYSYGGSADIHVDGELYVKGSIETDGSILSVGSLSAESVQVKTADSEIGVFKGYKPKAKAQSKTSKQSGKSISDAIKELHKALQTSKNHIKTFLKSMFSFTDNGIMILSPIFSGQHDNTTSLTDLPSIDTEAGKKYIYPGDKFWKSKGCETFTRADEAANIKHERELGTSISGADSIKLHNRKDSKK